MSKSLKIAEDWAIGDLKPYAKNAKIHTKQQIQKIAKSIIKYGLVNPPHVEPDGTIITGHGRTLAIESLGWRDVPVIVRYDLNKAQSAALRIADNKVSEGEIDTNILHDELRWLEKELDDDLSDMGFDEKELAFLTADLGELGESFLLDDLELLDVDSESASEESETDGEIKEADKATTSIEKALGFKNLTGSEARKLKRFMAVITDSSDEVDPKAVLFGHIDEVMTSEA